MPKYEDFKSQSKSDNHAMEGHICSRTTTFLIYIYTQIHSRMDVQGIDQDRNLY